MEAEPQFDQFRRELGWGHLVFLASPDADALIRRDVVDTVERLPDRYARFGWHVHAVAGLDTKSFIERRLVD
jgi:hypothetical protein